MKKHTLTCWLALMASLLLSLHGTAQPTNSKSSELFPPLAGKLLLSAGYLELRANHFHSGIDIKIGGVVGAKLFAINEGYVSRIKVSAGGYGKCLYVKHPNGFTSVYAHLNGYSPTLSSLVEQAQYERKLFEFDTLLAPNAIAVKKGELIGYAGNSGHSFGPHLHFEIRNADEIPINPTDFYTFADKLAPELHTLAFFTIDSVRSTPQSRMTHCINLKAVKGAQKIDSIIHIESPAYVGLESIDRMNDTQNKFGIRTMRVELDGEPIFAARFDRIPFSQTGYINSILAYDELCRNEKLLVKTYVEPANPLNIFDVLKSNGLITLTDDKVHKLSIAVADDKANTSTLNVRIQKKKTRGAAVPDSGGKLLAWDKDSYYLSESIAVYMAKGALYNNILFDVEQLDTLPNTFSPLFRLHRPETGLHGTMEVAIRTNIPEPLRSKAVVAYYESDPTKAYSIGGKWNNGFVNVSAGQFGYFYVTVDTIAPTVTPSFKKGANLSKHNSLTIKIKDELSGIKSYNGYIDDRWVLLEYDAKSRTLTHQFSKKYTAQGKKHKLRLEVCDNKGNLALLNTEFTW